LLQPITGAAVRRAPHFSNFIQEFYMADVVSNLFYGAVRGATRPNYSEGDSRVGLTNGGEQVMAEGLPRLTEITRQGNSWSAVIPTASAFTHVADMPTTRAELALWNGEATKSYVIDAAWYYSLTSITAASGATLIYQVGYPATLTDNTAILINSPMGKVYGGKAKRALAVTTMVANKWAALASGVTGAAASIGHGIFADVQGRIILPPGATLGLNVVVGTATGTALIGVSWHEVELKY
jgi:hypothetical protein